MGLGITIHYGASRFDFIQDLGQGLGSVDDLRDVPRRDLSKIGRAVSDAMGLKDPESAPKKARRPNPHRRRHRHQRKENRA